MASGHAEQFVSLGVRRFAVLACIANVTETLDWHIDLGRVNGDLDPTGYPLITASVIVLSPCDYIACEANPCLAELALELNWIAARAKRGCVVDSQVGGVDVLEDGFAVVTEVGARLDFLHVGGAASGAGDGFKRHISSRSHEAYLLCNRGVVTTPLPPSLFPSLFSQTRSAPANDANRSSLTIPAGAVAELSSARPAWRCYTWRGCPEKRLDRFHVAVLRRVTVMAAGEGLGVDRAVDRRPGSPSAMCAFIANNAWHRCRSSSCCD